MTIVYYAELRSSACILRACGVTQQQARQAVLNAWAASYPDQDAPEVRVSRFTLGVGYDDTAHAVGAPAMAEGPGTARFKRETGQRS